MITMKVVMCPKTRSPYLKRLIKNLQALDIDVVSIPNFTISAGVFNFARLLKEVKNADIIHFH